MKKVLFVTYGGGHATMVAPVIRVLGQFPGISSETLALTLAGPYFKAQGLSYKGFKDFILPGDEAALAWGRKLAAQYHHPSTGIEEDEAVAYLGLSYWDLITRFGEVEAQRLCQEQQRGAFYPLSVLDRVLDRVQPDIVVTTNSPRSEQAAVEAANARGIPTLSMQDLFGVFNWSQPQADYVTVISPMVRENIVRDVGLRAGQEYLVTGNPAFDLVFDYRGPVSAAWRRAHLPGLPEGAKALLWVDDNGYIGKQTDLLHIRTESEIISDLDALARATKQSGSYLLIRPHPSQQRTIFDAWMKRTAHPHVLFAGGLPLYPLLNAVDGLATYTSTVGLEALLMERPVLQLGYYPGKKTLLLAEWGVARLAEMPAQLPDMVAQTLHEPIPTHMQTRINEMFPNERAAPKVAEAINQILHSARLRHAV